MLVSLGFPVVDADSLVHQALETTNEVRQAVVRRFGSEIVTSETQAINRKALAARIFHNPEEKQWLEGLLHPIVRKGIQAFFQQHHTKALAFALVPLIFETQSEALYDEVWCVSSTEAQQIERLLKGRGMSLEEIHARMENQMPLPEKMKLAHRTLHNHLDEPHLRMEVERCIHEALAHIGQALPA